MIYTILAIAISLFLSGLILLIKRIGRDEVIKEVENQDARVAIAIQKMGEKERARYEKETGNTSSRKFNYITVPAKKSKSHAKSGVKNTGRMRHSDR